MPGRPATVSVRARQWAVGHGGFHTQEVSVAASVRIAPLVFVYDCGSSGSARQLRLAISEFVDDLRRRNIDTVEQIVLSHFDEDHVSQLRELGRRLRGNSRMGAPIAVRRVVAPFVGELEALRLVLDAPGRRATWRRELVVNTRALLSRQFPGADVILLGEESEDSPQADAPPVALSENAQVSRSRGGGVSIHHRRQDGHSGLGTVLWEVRPAVKQTVSESAEQFRLLLRDVGLVRENIPALIDTLGRRVGRRRLREALHYLPGIRDANFTSIALYSGAPTLRKSTSWSVSTSGYDWASGRADGAVGWLGTGDGYFCSVDDLDELKSMFLPDQLQSVRVVAAPHHGSPCNSDPDFWSLFKSGSVTTLHASPPRYGLPHPAVLQAIAGADITAITLHENSSHADIVFDVRTD